LHHNTQDIFFTAKPTIEESEARGHKHHKARGYDHERSKTFVVHKKPLFSKTLTKKQPLCIFSNAQQKYENIHTSYFFKGVSPRKNTSTQKTSIKK